MAGSQQIRRYTAAMKVSAASTVLQVKDIPEALRFYCEVLGFEKDFEFGPYAGRASWRMLSSLVRAYDLEEAARRWGGLSVFR